ncbi:MAG: hypothetical protein AAF664_16345, partial [Planctomycetota bacterium]
SSWLPRYHEPHGGAERRLGYSDSQGLLPEQSHAPASAHWLGASMFMSRTGERSDASGTVIPKACYPSSRTLLLRLIGWLPRCS